MKKIISIVLSVVMLVTCLAIGSFAAPLKKLDLAFVIDTTGSMSDDIYEVQQNMKTYLEDLDEAGMDYRIAVVDYRDFPDRTGDSYDYPYQVQLDFSSDYDEILAAINGLTLGYGGDDPETLYSALVDGLDELSWRKSAGKAAIIMGDAPALDPEPYTGYTKAMVVEKMNTGKIATESGYEKVATYAASETRSAVTLFTIATSEYYDTNECFEALAEETGGKAYTAEDSSEITDAITEIIEEIPEEVEPGEEEGFFAKFVNIIMKIVYFFTFQWDKL